MNNFKIYNSTSVDCNSVVDRYKFDAAKRREMLFRIFVAYTVSPFLWPFRHKMPSQTYTTWKTTYTTSESKSDSLKNNKA